MMRILIIVIIIKGIIIIKVIIIFKLIIIGIGSLLRFGWHLHFPITFNWIKIFLG
jgi:hypothetical protein